MFYENSSTSDFSFEQGLPAHTPENENRHLINQLRLEFRTASQRQLEEAIDLARNTADSRSSEKILLLARASLHALLTPQLDRAGPQESEPPFRAPAA